MRALTRENRTSNEEHKFVEMGVSPLRALIHSSAFHKFVYKISRNGSKPVEGIDTKKQILNVAQWGQTP